LHRSGWCDILLEGFTLNPSYLTLYDFDYFIGEGYLCEIHSTTNCHWRAVPATTNTFACKYKTLSEDMEIHRYYSGRTVWIPEKRPEDLDDDGYNFSKDYDKFMELAKKHKKYIISSIPGWSTHCDANHLSSTIDWENVINSKTQKPNFILKYKY